MTLAVRRALLWTAGVTLLLLVPLPGLVSNLGRGALFGIGKDKLVHFALFVPLTWSWLDARGGAASGAGRAMLGSALLVWGGILELVQGWSGFRNAEWSDLLADAIGVLVAFALPRWWPLAGRTVRSAAAGDRL